MIEVDPNKVRYYIKGVFSYNGYELPEKALKKLKENRYYTWIHWDADSLDSEEGNSYARQYYKGFTELLAPTIAKIDNVSPNDIIFEIPISNGYVIKPHKLSPIVIDVNSIKLDLRNVDKYHRKDLKDEFEMYAESNPTITIRNAETYYLINKRFKFRKDRDYAYTKEWIKSNIIKPLTKRIDTWLYSDEVSVVDFKFNTLAEGE